MTYYGPFSIYCTSTFLFVYILAALWIPATELWCNDITEM